MWTIIVVLLAVIMHDWWWSKRRREIIEWSIRTDQRLAELEWRVEHAPGVSAKEAREMHVLAAHEDFLDGLREDLKRLREKPKGPQP